MLTAPQWAVDLRAGYLDQPHEVALETLALCNARCSFCPYGNLGREGERMDDELIDKVVAEMATWTKPFYFSPFKVNEPLLDKRVLPLMKRIEREVPMARLRLFTNGAALTTANMNEIAGLDKLEHLWVSLNSTDPDEYESLMRIPFERTARNLDALHERDFPHRVVLSTVGTPDEDFRKACYLRWPKFDSVAIKQDGWLGKIEPQDSRIPDKPCMRWFEMSIAATGVVTYCCMDGIGDYPLGNIRERSLLSIYNELEWRNRRERLLSRHWVNPCNHCTYG